MIKTKKRWATLIVALFACVCFGHAAPDVKPSSIYGHWLVKRLIPTGGISAGPEDLNPWMGTGVFYSAAEARFGKQVIKNPKYKARRVSAADFFSENRIGLKEIGIRAPFVFQIDVVDDGGRDVHVRGPGPSVVIRDANHLVTFWDGGTFEMVRTK